MRWTNSSTEKWADLLRLALKFVLVINAFMFAVFSVWFTAMFLWRLCRYLLRAWLGHPW